MNFRYYHVDANDGDNDMVNNCDSRITMITLTVTRTNNDNNATDDDTDNS